MLALNFVAVLAALKSLQCVVVTSNLTCFTCSSNSNEACNRRAIDEPCSIHDAICMTVHTFMPDDFQTVRVDKKCVSHCNKDVIGCRLSNISNSIFHKTCTYCCDKSYCNINTTLDTIASISHSRSLLNSSSSNQPAHSIIFLLPFIIFQIFVKFF